MSDSDASKEVINVATEGQKREAAMKRPKDRSVPEQHMVDDNPSQAVRNLDYESRRQERAGR